MYVALAKNIFLYIRACHKYEFVNKKSGTHTQAIESFKNCLKLEIKKIKGYISDSNEFFLQEFI